MTKKDTGMIELTGLWKSKTKGGAMMLTGYIGNARLRIFKNSYKEKEGQPDYIAYVTAPPPKEQEEDPLEDGDVEF